MYSKGTRVKLYAQDFAVAFTLLAIVGGVVAGALKLVGVL